MGTNIIIAESAFQLFLEKGFSDVSVNDIVQHSGITKGGFYHHYKSKDDLIGFIFHTYICPYYDYIISVLADETKTLKERFFFFCHSVDGCERYMKYTLKWEKVEWDVFPVHHFYFLLMEGYHKYPYMFTYRSLFCSRARNALTQALEQGCRMEEIRRDTDIGCLSAQMLAYNEGITFLHIIEPQNKGQWLDTLRQSAEELWHGIAVENFCHVQENQGGNYAV